MESVCSLIEKNLKEAIVYLSDGEQKTTIYRPKTDVARLLLSRLYLYKKEWQKAIDTCNELIANTSASITTFYRIDKQTEHTFWFHSLSDNIVKLHKSEDPNDSIVFAGNALEATPTYNEVTERDSVVNYKNTRYRAYVYINPSKMKVIKTTYSEEGLSMDNVYYDNVMHICVYEGKKSLYASDITKQMFAQVVSKNFLDQSILSDMQFVGVNKKGFHYQATLSIPESQVCCIANLTVDFEGKLAISVDK